VSDPEPRPAPDDPAADAGTPAPRPLVERIGMGAIALLLAALFAVMALAAFQGGEPFLGVMSAIGCMMVVWVGALTVLRGR
jgi:hypothetical protein